MKWKNKGHEFDEIACKLKNSKVYLFGAGEIGKKVYESLKREKVVGFIDNSIEKQKERIDGKKIYALEDVELCENEIIVVCALNPEYKKAMYRQLMESNIEKNQIIDYKLYEQIRCCYEKNQIILTGVVSVWLTRKCTLKCKNCIALFPYMEPQKEMEVDKLIDDINFLFEKVDYVSELGIAGGETFLYKELLKYIENIGRFRDKIGYLNIVTNGSIVPNDEILFALNKYRIHITISVYPNVIDNLSERRAMLIRKLEEYKISYNLSVREEWVAPLCEKNSRKELNSEELEDFFDKCHTVCRLYNDKKLYYCLLAKSMHEVGLLSKEDEDNVFNLEVIQNKKELVEFEYGFNHRGYVEGCKYCNGYLESNQNYVPVAEQIKREDTKEDLYKKILG